MAKKLTRAEKDQIIYNEGHGILHPENYCYTTKSGSIQIRKRKQALTVPISENKEPQPTPEPTQPTPTKKEEDYDSVSNKQLLEKMLEILEKNNNTNNNQNLNDPEREKEKEENKQFIENIRSCEHAQLPTRDAGRTQEERHETEQPKEAPQWAKAQSAEAASTRGFLRGTQEEEPKQERPEQREPRERALRPRPQPRGRRFIEPVKRIQEEQEQTTQPIKKVRGRIL